MKHLWSVSGSQQAGMSVSWCGKRMDLLPDGDCIVEQPPVDCPGCMAATSWAPHPANVTFTPGATTVTVTGLGIGAECRHREMHVLGTACDFCASDKERSARIRELEANRPRLIDYLKMKQDAEDWHGVQDAASDLRDLDSELGGLRY